jgi:hypothetical protein
MNDPFYIPVSYKNTDYQFEAQLLTTAYGYKIEVLVGDVSFMFERDEEGNFRALPSQPENDRVLKTDPVLLQAVANSIEDILS